MAERLIAIDAAKKKSGYAYFLDGNLRVSGAVTGFDYAWPEVDVLVIEVPQVYRNHLSKGDPNDLIDCAFCAGAFAGRITHGLLVTYRPRQWKRQLPKAVHHRRVIEALSASDDLHLLPGPELGAERYETSQSKRLDQLDAIGLGLYHMGRLS